MRGAFMRLQKIGNPYLFLLFWVLGTGIAFAAIGFGLHYPSGFGTTLFRPDYNAAVFGAILGAVSGLIVAFPQWLILRRYIKGNGLWVLSLVLGIALRHAMGDGSPRDVNIYLLPIPAISLSLLIQAFSLRRAIPKPYLWLLIGGLSYFLAIWLSWIVLDAIGWRNQPWTPFFGAMRYALVAGIEGAGSALGTGLGLIWLLNKAEDKT
jgi:hypothetical protein